MVRIIDFFSLQVVAGSCISAIFISRIYDQVTPLLSFFCLGLTVLVIYSFDHYQDSLKIRSGKLRHTFSNDKFLVKIIIVVAILFNSLIIFFIPRVTVIGGIILGVFILAYFFLLRKAGRNLWVLKEFLIALIFSAGVFLPGATAGKEISVSTTELFLFIEFFLLAWTNLLIFSWFDLEYDRKSDFPSSVRVMGRFESRKLIYILLALFAVVWVSHLILVPDFPTRNRAVTFLMGFILTAIILNQKYFSKFDRYRFIGDAIFLLPILSLL